MKAIDGRSSPSPGIVAVRVDLGNEITDVRKEVAGVRKEITKKRASSDTNRVRQRPSGKGRDTV